MTDKTVDWGTIIAAFALGIFLLVAVVIIGGWAFSVGWNVFMVEVLALPEISIAQGVSAMLTLWVTGWALGLRRNTTNIKK